MATITTTEAGATGRYIDLGSPAAMDDIGAQTIIVYCKPASASPSVTGYLYAKGLATGFGPRVSISATTGLFSFGAASNSGGSSNPSKAASSAITASTWQHLQVTWDGSINASGIDLYIDAGSALANTPFDGVGTVTTDAANNVFLMNRTGGLGREFVGDIAYIAVWSGVLNSTQRTNVRNNGPLSEPTGLKLLWANDQDYSTNAFTASARSTRVTGGTPTNTALGGDVTITATVGNAVASGITASLATGVSIAATPGNAVAAGITATITNTAMAFDASYERSSFNPTGSSISGTGDSAIISINPKLQESEVGVYPLLWMEPSVDVTGVNGFRPTFRILGYKDSSGGLHGGTGSWQSTRRPMYSTDSGLTWTYFDTAVTRDVGNQWVEFRNSAAFTSNTVRISRSRQISVHQVGDWMASFAAAHSEFVPTDSAVAYTPTGAVSGFAAQTFIADEFSAQTDSQGANVPVTPFYAGMINDTALMPLDGSSKRIAFVSCGVHAGEDYAHWSMRGFLDYVMGASAEAQALRRRYRILVYPMVNAPGRAGGGWRGSWTQGTGGVDDANRHFDNALGLEIVSKPKAAMTTDFGSYQKDWSMDFHGIYLDNWQIISPYSSSLHTRFHSLQQTNSGETITSAIQYDAGYMIVWLQSTMGFKYSVGLEHGDPVQHSDGVLAAYGAAMVPTLATMAAEGAFGIVATPGNAVAAGITASITTAGVTIISATPGNAVAAGITATITTAGVTTISATPGNAAADGSMASIVRKITASPGDAVANGSIAAILRIIAASPGGAVANGATATITGAGPVTETIARPISDTSNAGWTASTGGALYAMVDEVTPDALDYIVATSVGAVCELALNPTAYPGTATQQQKYRASSSTGHSLIVRVKQGATIIRSHTQALTATDTEYTITLTSGEIAAITSGMLSVEFESA